MRAGQDPAAWLVQALEQACARPVRHYGHHLYAFALGRSRPERATVTIALPGTSYPKRCDPAPV